MNKTIRPPRRILVVLFLGVLMAALDIAIVGPTQRAIQEAFGIDERAFAWVFSVFVLCNLLGLPLMTKLADVFGRRVLFIMDVLLFGLGSLVVALSPSFEILLIGRGIQGVAASGIFPVASAVIGDTFPPEKRGRALGVLGAVYGLAFIIGPIIAGILLQVGWSWVFLVNVPLAFIAAFLGYTFLPTLRPAEAKPLDWGGIVTLGVLLVSLAYGLNLIETDAFFSSITSLNVWPFLVFAMVLIPVFIRIEKKTAEPLLRLNLFRSRQVVLVSLFATGAGLTEAAFIFFPAFAIAAYGVADSTASFMLLPLAFAVAVSSPVAGRILDRVGSRAIVMAGSAGLAAGIGVMGLVPGGPAIFYLGTILVGFGLAALLGSALSYILLSESRATERTVVQGIITVFISIGQTIGAALIGAVVASSEGGVAGYTAAFLSIAGFSLVLTLLSFGLKKRASELQAATQGVMETEDSTP
ncbi:MAG: MFS transporter [Rhodothermales bacterium]